jgi:hypothetical protein
MADLTPQQRTVAAQMALYAMCAEALFGSIKGTANAHGTPQLNAPVEYGAVLDGVDWRIHGEIRCTDNLGVLGSLLSQFPFHFDTGEYFYGFLLERLTDGSPIAKGDFLAIVRGTELTAEWILNTEIIHDPFPLKTGVFAYVPLGFHSIYKTMTLVVDGQRLFPAAPAIGNIVGKKKLTVAGHSLGAALGTYLTYDLATYTLVAGGPNLNVDAWLFASPNPGEANLAEAFYAAVNDYVVVNWERDAVPKVPPYPYVPVRGVFQLTLDNVTVAPWNPVDLGCNHDLVSYAKMLDPAFIVGNPSPCFTPPVTPDQVAEAVAGGG